MVHFDSKLITLIVITISWTSLIIPIRSEGVIDSLCCMDVPGDNCTITTNSTITIWMYRKGNQIIKPSATKDAWQKTDNGTVLTDCQSSMPGFNCSVCETEGGSDCGGTIEYCSYFPCSMDYAPRCRCKSEKGEYVQYGQDVNEQDVWIRTEPFECSTTFSLPERRRHERKDVTPATPSVQTEALFAAFGEESLTIMFDGPAYRTLSTVCRSKTSAFNCNSSICTIPIVSVCISGENLVIYAYKGPMVTDYTMTCPLYGSPDVCGEYGLRDAYDNWSLGCLPTWAKVMVVLAFLWLIMTIIRLMKGYFGWLGYPFRGMKKLFRRKFKQKVDEESPKVSSKMRHVSATQVVSMVGLICLLNVGMGESALPYSVNCGATGGDLPSNQVICTNNGQTRTCALTPEVTYVLSYPGDVACYTLRDGNSTAVASLYIQYVSHEEIINTATEYYTSDYQGLQGSHKDCPTVGNCDGNWCSNVAPNFADINGTISGAVTQYPGISRCEPSCGCAGCGCFVCSSGCLSSRWAYKPIGDVHRLDSMISYQQKPTVMLTLVNGTNVLMQLIQKGIGFSQQNQTTLQLSGSFRDSTTLFPGKGILWNFLNPVATSYLVLYAVAGAPEVGKIGTIQANDAASLLTPGTGNFRIAVEEPPSSIGQSAKTFFFPTSAFNNLGYIARRLPLSANGQVWTYFPYENKFNASGTGAGTVLGSIRLDPSGPITFERTINLVCPDLTFNSYGGCSSCLSRAFINITANSKCFAGQATAYFCLGASYQGGTCNPQDASYAYPVPINLLTTPSSFKVYFTASTDKKILGAICLTASGAKPTCKSWAGFFPASVDVGNNTYVPGIDANNGSTVTTKSWMKTATDAVTDFASRAYDYLSDAWGSITGKIIIIAIIIAVVAGAVFLLFLFKPSLREWIPRGTTSMVVYDDQSKYAYESIVNEPPRTRRRRMA